MVDETIEKLIINASVLQAIIKLEASRESERLLKGGSLRGITKTLFVDAHSFKEFMFKKYQVKHTLNRNYRSFTRQLNDFKKGSYYAIIKDPEGKRKKNAKKRTDKVDALLNNLFAGRKYKPNATEVAQEYDAFLNGYIDVINESTGEIYNPSEFKQLDIRTITNYLATYSSKIGTYAKRSGDRQVLMQDFIPYETLEQPKFAGSMISIDDRQPPFKYDAQNRMWWYLGIDLASECITAWAFGKTKKELIINFYRQMVRNYYGWSKEFNTPIHIPDALECESSLNSSFKNTFLQEGRMFQNVQIHPNSARSKRIEGYFKPLRYGIEKKQEGWIARPFALSESNQKSNEQVPIVPYDKLVAQCFANIVKWNNMPNTQDKSISRFDYFIQRQHPNLKPTNYKGIVKFLGKTTESSCKAGIMKLQYKEWFLGDEGEIYTGEKLIKLLELVEGKDVAISWLDDNEGKIIKAYVYINNRFICEALPKPIAARAPIERKSHHLDARELVGRYRNTVTAYMKMQKNKIDKVTVIDRRKETISDTFAIPGYESYKPSTETVEDLGYQNEEQTITINQSVQTSKSWSDAFN